MVAGKLSEPNAVNFFHWTAPAKASEGTADNPAVGPSSRYCGCMNFEKWEYTLVDTVISAYKDTNNQVAEWLWNLNALGEQGWEVASSTIIHGRGSNGQQWPILLLKRRKLDPSTGR